MKMTGIASYLINALWLQTFAISIYSRLPIPVYHGLSKVVALKKAFYYIGLDELEGDYLEFGVFQGSSFISAHKCWKSIGSSHHIPRAFFGFDSFEGVKVRSEADEHPSWIDGAFEVDFQKVQKRISRSLKGADWKLIQGYLEDTIEGKEAGELGIGKVAIALVDVDLGVPAKIALDFIKPSLQEGSIVIFDDYLFYKGSPDRGEQWAFAEFQRENANFVFRRLFDYGVSGRAFVLSEIRGD